MESVYPFEKMTQKNFLQAIISALFFLYWIGANAQDQSSPTTKYLLEPDLIENAAPDLEGVAIPRKPFISSMRLFERLDQITESPSGQLRSAGSLIYKTLADGVVVVYANDGMGSGAVVDHTGLIVTNWHVVEDDKTVGIQFKSTLTGIRATGAYVGDVVRVHKQSDLALIRLRAPPDGLTVLPLGKLNEVQIGSDVHGIGHPEDEYWTYARGAVSQIREDYQWPYSEGYTHKATVIQTQTPVNPGASGSPLFSNEGNLVGINSFSRGESEGMHFAVSVKDVRVLLAQDQPEPLKFSTLPEPLADYSSMQRDTNQNGISDWFGFDTDQNDKIDLYAADENEDGVADYWELDRNENGVRDGAIVPASDIYTDMEGWLWIFDSDEDEEPETEGADFDSDGRVDWYKPWE